MLVIVQVVGALLILAPFAAHQFGTVDTDAPIYLWPNLVGSTALAVLAAISSQWGFLLLEAAWAAVAAWSILRALVPTFEQGPPPPSRGSSQDVQQPAPGAHDQYTTTVVPTVANR